MLIKSRRDFFKEGDVLNQTFVNEIINQRRQFYQDKRDNRETIAIGIVFFFVTCICDYIVCTI